MKVCRFLLLSCVMIMADQAGSQPLVEGEIIQQLYEEKAAFLQGVSFNVSAVTDYVKRIRERDARQPALAPKHAILSPTPAPAPAPSETPLYAFSSITFTPAGQTGRTGPSLAMVQKAYGQAWTSNPAYLNVTQYGVQVWTVPATGTYSIALAGASAESGESGSGRGTKGAAGASFSIASLELLQNSRLYMVVGQRGGAGLHGGAGGGATLIYVQRPPQRSPTLLTVAGGGGGSTEGEAAESSIYLSGSGTLPQGGSGGRGFGAGGPGANGTLGSGGSGGSAPPGTSSDNHGGGGGGGGAGFPTDITQSTFAGGFEGLGTVVNGDGGFGMGGGAGAYIPGGGGGGGYVGGNGGAGFALAGSSGTSFVAYPLTRTEVGVNPPADNMYPVAADLDGFITITKL